MALPADQRPPDFTPVHTADLPDLPTRDRNIMASAWVEAPEPVLTAGDDIDAGEAAYKRRLGPWLLWRAGPAKGADARYVAVHSADLSQVLTYRLHADKSGSGVGADGATHTSFRTWKQSLTT